MSSGFKQKTSRKLRKLVKAQIARKEVMKTKKKTIKVIEITIGDKTFEIQKNDALRWDYSWMIQITNEKEAEKLEQYFKEFNLDDIAFETSVDDSDWKNLEVYESVDELKSAVQEAIGRGASLF